VLTGLRHHTLVGSNDEQTSINPANPSKHVTYESFVAGNVHEAHSAPAWEREPGEPKLNRKPSGFLLSQSIRIATIGDIDQNVAKFSLSDRQIPIRVSLSEDSRRDLSTIQNMPVPTVSGGTVPLRVVADISFGAGPTQIRRYNQIRRIVVGADLAPGLVTSQAMTKINALPTKVPGKSGSRPRARSNSASAIHKSPRSKRSRPVR